MQRYAVIASCLFCACAFDETDYLEQDNVCESSVVFPQSANADSSIWCNEPIHVKPCSFHYRVCQSTDTDEFWIEINNGNDYNCVGNSCNTAKTDMLKEECL